MNGQIECPYCGTDFEEEIEDAGQDETLHIECPECEKTFVGTACYDFSIDSVQKADCLNGGDHMLKRSLGVPKEYQPHYRCQLCDDHGIIQLFENYKFVDEV